MARLFIFLSMLFLFLPLFADEPSHDDHRVDIRTMSDSDFAKLVEKKVALLGDSDYQIREKATKQLATYGPRVIRRMAEATDSVDKEVGARAEHVLQMIGSEVAAHGTEAEALAALEEIAKVKAPQTAAVAKQLIAEVHCKYADKRGLLDRRESWCGTWKLQFNGKGSWKGKLALTQPPDDECDGPCYALDPPYLTLRAVCIEKGGKRIRWIKPKPHELESEYSVIRSFREGFSLGTADDGDKEYATFRKVPSP